MNRDPGGIAAPPSTKTRLTRKQLTDLAFRVRAGVQGHMLVCLCAYPIEKADNETGHDEYCPGHRHLLWQRQIAARRGDPPPPDVVMPSSSTHGPVCPTCQLPARSDGNCDECQPKLGGVA